MFKIFRYLKGFKKQLVIGPTFKLIEAIFELIVPLVMSKIVDVGTKNGDISYVLTMGGLMVLLGIVGLACSITCQYNAAIASQGFGTVLRNELFAHINTLSHKELDKIGTPSLITRMTNDINQLQTAVAMLIRLVIRAPFLVIGSAIIAFFIDAKLALIFLITIPFIALVLYVVMSKAVPLYKKVQHQLDSISRITRENLVGTRVIRAFLKQKSEQERFSNESDALKFAEISVGKLSALLNPLTYIILNIAIISIIWFGGYRVYDGVLGQGQIIALVQYMTQILLALVVVANLVVIFTKASACAKRINEIFDMTSSIADEENASIEQDAASSAIYFENVSFSYAKGSENALNDLTVMIEKGETVGIIGGTGSGKTTVINLIARFYDATKGTIYINGIPIKSYPLKKLRSIIGIVPQTATLFSGTLGENLRLGQEAATDEQLDKAVEIAQAKEFVDKFYDGYSHNILQGGKNLSGGQRQRITIARALVKNPEILILDDSFSALDFATDALLRSALKKSTDKMTVIMVSQRATSIKNADKIIVLDGGMVISIGTHDKLYESCEIYREICLSQEEKSEVQA